jgi:hypothetical protein
VFWNQARLGKGLHHKGPLLREGLYLDAVALFLRDKARWRLARQREVSESNRPSCQGARAFFHLFKQLSQEGHSKGSPQKVTFDSRPKSALGGTDFGRYRMVSGALSPEIVPLPDQLKCKLDLP